MTAKIRGPQVDAGTGADQLVQLDGSGNLPTVDGSALTNVDAASLGGSADTAYAKLASANTFTALQTITHTGDIGLSIEDSDGGVRSQLLFKPSGSSNFGATIENNITGAVQALYVQKLSGAGTAASQLKCQADGGVSIQNLVNPGAIVAIGSAGNITINAQAGQRITSSDDHRFFRTATFTGVTTAGTAIDWSLTNKFTCTVASGTLSFTGNPSAPASLVLKLTGTPSLPGSVRWPDGGAEPAKTGVTIVGLFYDGSTYYAMQGTNFL